MMKWIIFIYDGTIAYILEDKKLNQSFFLIRQLWQSTVSVNTRESTSFS